MTGNTSAARAADWIERESDVLAQRATQALFASRPAVRERFGSDAVAAWQRHLRQRLLELAAALSVDAPELFVARVAWARHALSARGLDDDDIDASIAALRAELARALDDTLAAPVMRHLDAALTDVEAVEPPMLDAGTPAGRLALTYIQAVLEGNVVPAMQMVLDALEDSSVRELYLDVLLPAQREVGRLWHEADITVAEEHLVTSTTQRLMAVLADRGRRQPDNGLTAVAATVAGNVHDIGIRSIAYLMELAGWRMIYLGADVPEPELPAAIRYFSPQVVLLSSSLTVQLGTVRETISRIREVCDPSVRIMVGGLALADAPQAWRELGADAYAADADAALELALELAGSDA